MLYLNECQNECQKEFAVSKVRQWNASVTAAIADPQMQSLLGCVSMSGMSYNRIQDICRTFCCNVLIGMRSTCFTAEESCLGSNALSHRALLVLQRLLSRGNKIMTWDRSSGSCMKPSNISSAQKTLLKTSCQTVPRCRYTSLKQL